MTSDCGPESFVNISESARGNTNFTQILRLCNHEAWSDNSIDTVSSGVSNVKIYVQGTIKANISYFIQNITGRLKINYTCSFIENHPDIMIVRSVWCDFYYLFCILVCHLGYLNGEIIFTLQVFFFKKPPSHIIFFKKVCEKHI